MPEYLAPGVYIEETTFRSRSIEGVPTSTTGFAGLTRKWTVSCPIDEADDLIALVNACPWRSAQTDSVSRDRFIYVITVRAPSKKRSATLPEASVTGPWKSLVQRVQDESPAPAKPPTPPEAC